MTKELELFKKWFGVDLNDFLGFKYIIIQKENIEIHFDLEKLKDSENAAKALYPLICTKGFIQDGSNNAFADFGEDTFVLLYKPNSLHHAELEQYIKEKYKNGTKEE